MFQNNMGHEKLVLYNRNKVWDRLLNNNSQPADIKQAGYYYIGRSE